MNKDTVVASAIGFGIGLVAAITLWVVPRLLPKTQTTSPKPSEAVVAKALSSTTPVTNNFTLSNLSDGQISKEKSLKIEGNAPSDSVIIVSTASNSATLSPRESGAFSTTLDLSEGANHIVVTNIASNQENSKDLVVYYYPEDL